MLLEPNRENISYCAAKINKGDIVGLPTDTVYGLACNAEDLQAIKKLFTLKKRPSQNPVAILIADHLDIYQLGIDLPSYIDDLTNTFWPGALTLIINKKKSISDVITAGKNTIGVRLPDNEIIRQIIRKSGKIIGVTSANLAGKVPLTNASAVDELFYHKIPVVDGGESNIGVASTVIDISTAGQIKILRKGSIDIKDLISFFDKFNLEINFLS